MALQRWQNLDFFKFQLGPFYGSEKKHSCPSSVNNWSSNVLQETGCNDIYERCGAVFSAVI